MQNPREKVVAVVPAYNEEALIGGVLKPLVEAKKQGTLDDVLVVDDGSSDGTLKKTLEVLGGGANASVSKLREIEKGVSEMRLAHGSVIRSHENLGKLESARLAAEYASRTGAGILFMTDADMLNLTPEKVDAFLGHLRGHPHIDMIRARYGQGPEDDPQKVECPPELSGFRAVRRPVWEDILRKLRNPQSRESEYRREGGFVLEAAVERIPLNKREVPGLGLISRERAKGASDHEEILLGISAGGEVELRRQEVAGNLRILRFLKDSEETLAGKSGKELSAMARKMKPAEVDNLLRKSDDPLAKKLLSLRKTAHDLRRKGSLALPPYEVWKHAKELPEWAVETLRQDLEKLPKQRSMRKRPRKPKQRY